MKLKRASETLASLLLAVLLAILLAVIVYFGCAFTALLFPANTRQEKGDLSINAYVISNGAHTDLLFPVKSTLFDWTRMFRLSDFSAAPATPRYIAIGWGDREFYLNTQNIADITFSRAAGALLGGHRTLIHVNYLSDLNFPTARYALPLTTLQYQSLIRYVQHSTVLQADGAATVIPGRHYGSQDAFYEARGSYSVFNTCNTWAGRGLLQAGAMVSRWTPLESMVVWHLPPSRPPPPP